MKKGGMNEGKKGKKEKRKKKKGRIVMEIM